MRVTQSRGNAPDALACRPHGHPPPARPLRPARRIAARGRRDGLGRGGALPPHVHDAAALLGRDAPAGARALARGDELQPAPAGELERAGPRRVHVRGAAPAVRHLQGQPDRHGPGGRRVPPPRDRRPRDVGGARGARPPPLVVRQRHRHAGRAARLDLGPRRPDPDARRLPDRVEQAARAGPRDRAPGRRRARPRGLRGGVRRRRRRLDARAGRVGRLAQRLPRRGLLAAAGPAHPHAQRQPGRLRAHDAPLDGADPRRDGRAAALRPPDLLRLLQHALAREPRHEHGARAGGRHRRPHRRARSRLPARRARALPRRARGGLVGELPLLRRAAVLRRQARGRRGMEAPHGERARGRRHAPLQPHGAARLRPGDGARPARPGRRGPAPGPDRRRQAEGLRRGDRQHRVSARPRRLQHPARAHRGQRRAARAPTCSARPRRSTPTSATS